MYILKQYKELFLMSLFSSLEGSTPTTSGEDLNQESFEKLTNNDSINLKEDLTDEALKNALDDGTFTQDEYDFLKQKLDSNEIAKTSLNKLSEEIKTVEFNDKESFMRFIEFTQQSTNNEYISADASKIEEILSRGESIKIKLEGNHIHIDNPSIESMVPNGMINEGGIIINTVNKDDIAMDIIEGLGGDIYFDKSLLTQGAHVRIDGEKLFINNKEVRTNIYTEDGYEEGESQETDKWDKVDDTVILENGLVVEITDIDYSNEKPYVVSMGNGREKTFSFDEIKENTLEKDHGIKYNFSDEEFFIEVNGETVVIGELGENLNYLIDEANDFKEKNKAMSDLVNNEGEHHEEDTGDVEEFPEDKNLHYEGSNGSMSQKQIESINKVINAMDSVEGSHEYTPAENLARCRTSLSKIKELRKSMQLENNVNIVSLLSLTQNVNALESQVKSLQKENIDLGKINSELETEKNQLKLQVERYIKEITRLASETQLQSEEITKYTNEIKILESSLDYSKSTIKGLRALRSTLEQKLIEKNNTINSLEKHSDNQTEYIENQGDKIINLTDNLEDADDEISNLEKHSDNQAEYIENQGDEIIDLTDNLEDAEDDIDILIEKNADIRKKLADKKASNDLLKKQNAENLADHQNDKDSYLQSKLRLSKRLPKDILGYNNPEKPTSEEILTSLRTILDNCDGGRTGHGLNKEYYNANKERVDFTLQVALSGLGINVGSIDANAGRNTKGGIGKYQKKFSMSVDNDAGAQVYSRLIADIEANFKV